MVIKIANPPLGHGLQEEATTHAQSLKLSKIYDPLTILLLMPCVAILSINGTTQLLLFHKCISAAFALQGGPKHHASDLNTNL